jgi:hypothetical protein
VCSAKVASWKRPLGCPVSAGDADGSKLMPRGR